MQNWILLFLFFVAVHRTNERKTLKNSRLSLLRHGASLSPSSPHAGHLYSFLLKWYGQWMTISYSSDPCCKYPPIYESQAWLCELWTIIKKKILGFGNYFSCTLHKVIDGLHCMCPSAMPDMMDDLLNAPAYSIFRLQEEKSLLMHFFSLPVFYCPNRFGTF